MINVHINQNLKYRNIKPLKFNENGPINKNFKNPIFADSPNTTAINNTTLNAINIQNQNQFHNKTALNIYDNYNNQKNQNNSLSPHKNENQSFSLPFNLKGSFSKQIQNENYKQNKIVDRRKSTVNNKQTARNKHSIFQQQDEIFDQEIQSESINGSPRMAPSLPKFKYQNYDNGNIRQNLQKVEDEKRQNISGFQNNINNNYTKFQNQQQYQSPKQEEKQSQVPNSKNKSSQILEDYTYKQKPLYEGQQIITKMQFNENEDELQRQFENDFKQIREEVIQNKQGNYQQILKKNASSQDDSQFIESNDNITTGIQNNQRVKIFYKNIKILSKVKNTQINIQPSCFLNLDENLCVVGCRDGNIAILSLDYPQYNLVFQTNDFKDQIKLETFIHYSEIILLKKLQIHGKQYLVSSSTDKNVLVWQIDFQEKQLIKFQKFSQFQNVVCAILDLGDNQHFVCGDTKGDIMIFNQFTGDQIPSPKGSHKARIIDIIISEQIEQYLTKFTVCSYDNVISVYEIQYNGQNQSIEKCLQIKDVFMQNIGGDITHIAKVQSQFNNIYLLCTTENFVQVYDINQNKILEKERKHDSEIKELLIIKKNGQNFEDNNTSYQISFQQNEVVKYISIGLSDKKVIEWQINQKNPYQYSIEYEIIGEIQEFFSKYQGKHQVQILKKQNQLLIINEQSQSLINYQM
ncbi:WD40-repeat-containing domain [Pseudocohnilembus persalinus]|uniref:WD40-repeat-containing domain n=1 Tax=Pseudocohnilembus persalinus TaxID=266149 RepID=A0A0V0QCH5_PSEPJ|nr:WD40-repeat-containing domain [Pseudocohnilembus persalinus]|eukprot:KRW99925.1 WD40-repeat-containing domain [Pseudocohnilembus persalinus]